MQKHPHVRGEDEIAEFAAPSAIETPPRAWGRLSNINSYAILNGNTPTCVGKTSFNEYCRHEVEKHPHVRGEDTPFY